VNKKFIINEEDLITVPQETEPKNVGIDMTKDMFKEISGMIILGAKIMKRNKDGKHFLVLKTNSFWEDGVRCYFIVSGDQSLEQSGIFFPCDLSELEENGESVWSVAN